MVMAMVEWPRIFCSTKILPPAGEGVVQDVCILLCPFDHHLEGSIAVTKQAAMRSRQLTTELGADGHAVALGAGEGNAVRGYLGLGQIFYLRLAGAGNETEFYHHQQIGVKAFAAGSQQALNFVRIEKGDLGHLVGPQAIEQVFPLSIELVGKVKRNPCQGVRQFKEKARTATSQTLSFKR